MFRASRSGDDASSGTLNSLQLVEIRGRRAVKHRVAVVKSSVDHWTGVCPCGVGWDVLLDVTQHSHVEVERLANAVDVFIEGPSVVSSHSQTSDASRQFDDDTLKVKCVWRTFRSLSWQWSQSCLGSLADHWGRSSQCCTGVKQSHSVETEMTSLSAMYSYMIR